MLSELDHDIKGRLNQVQGKLAAATKAAGRSMDEIELVAVSKGQSAQAVEALWNQGVTAMAENYLAEALTKQSKLRALPMTWHFIGQIQSNKTADISTYFDWVQSLDRLKIARRLNDQRPANLAPLNTCVQINISRERGKGGITTEEALSFCHAIRQFPRLRLRGLMAIPRSKADAVELERDFKILARLVSHINSTLSSPNLDTLSIGMSADFPMAIACGSTMVRIGTALFGPRLEC